MDSFSKGFSQLRTRTQLAVADLQERIGGPGDEKTELPAEYLELEKRCDALKTAHQRLLSVTSNYANEGYDYPPNLRESFVDFGKSISERVQGLANAHTAQEAQSVFTKPATKGAPKTLSHALARAALAGTEVLGENDSFGKALEKYALAQDKIGESRLIQDDLIVQRFNNPYNVTLKTQIAAATESRRKVQQARLELDSAKSKFKNAKPEFQDARRVEVEQCEDAFVTLTEEALDVMKNTLDTLEPLRGLADLIAAQLEYHKQAYEVLSELAPTIDAMQVDAESQYREKRSK